MDRSSYRIKCIFDQLVDLVNEMNQPGSKRGNDMDMYSLLIYGSALAFMKMNMLDSVFCGHGIDYSRFPEYVQTIFDKSELEDMAGYIYTGYSYDEEINSVRASKRSADPIEREAIVHDIKSDLSGFYEELVRIYGSSRKNTQVPFTRELSQLIHEILKRENITEVYNPFSGLGSLGLYPDLKYTGQESDRQNILVSKIRYYLNGKSDATVHRENSIEFWDRSFVKHQAIVSVLPMGNKMPEIQYANHTYKTLEDYFLNLSIDEVTLTERGIVIAVMPAIRLYSPKSLLQTRNRLVANNQVEAVVALPRYYTQTNADMALLILKKGRQSDYIKMVDATGMLKGDRLDYERIIAAMYHAGDDRCVDIHLDDVMADNGNLYPLSYLLDFDVVVGEGNRVFNFTEVAHKVPFVATKDKRGKLVHRNDLSPDTINYLVKPSDITEEEFDTACCKVTDRVLLLSKIGHLSPVIVDASEDSPVYVQHYMDIYKVDDSVVDEEYLVYYLSKSYSDFKDKQSELRDSSKNGLNTPLTNAFIRKFRVAVPDTLEQQKAIIKGVRQERALAKIKELHLEEVIAQMKAEYMDQVRLIRHDIRPHLRQLASIKKLISLRLSSLDMTGLDAQAILLKQDEFTSQMSLLMVKYEKALSSISELVEQLVRENSFQEAEMFNVDKYFHTLQGKRTIDDVSFRIKYHCDCASLLRSHVLNPKLYEPGLDEMEDDVDLETLCMILELEEGIIYPIDFKWRFNELHKDIDGVKLYSEQELAIERELIQRYLDDPEYPSVPNIGTTHSIWKPTSVQETFEGDFNQAMGFYDVFARISKVDFERMVDNIISNAIYHGFTPMSGDNEIYIKLSVDPDNDRYVIDFRNNGKPFPMGLTRERYGLDREKAGPTGRTGSGGYIVKTVAEHFGGDYDVLMVDDMPTVRVYLPIVRYFDC